MNRAFLKFTVLSISILSMGATALSPALANISAAFKDADVQTIMLLVSLPSITMVLASLVFGKLSDYLSRRGLFFLGIMLFLIGGLVPYFMNDLTMILVMRGVLGLGIGVTFPLSILLITDFFEGDERNTVMGLQGVFMCTGGLIFPLIGGLLCTTGWHNTFLTYLVGLVMLLFIAACLPEPAKVKQVIEQGGSAKKVPIPGKVYFMEFLWFLITVLWFTFFINIAIQIVGDNLGNSASAGFAATAFTIGGIVAGLMFGKIVQILKETIIPVGWLVTGIGMAIIAGVYNFNVLLVGAFIAGLGVTVACSGYWIALSAASPPSRVAQVIAMASVLSSLGQFVVPFVFTAICGFFGQGPGRFPILVSAIVLLVIGVLLLLQHYTQQPKAANIKA
jgi:MFS family permease